MLSKFLETLQPYAGFGILAVVVLFVLGLVVRKALKPSFLMEMLFLGALVVASLVCIMALGTHTS